MTNLYEAMVLLEARETKQAFEEARERVTALLSKHGAKPRVVRKWDERKLAYDIKGKQRGLYMITYFDAEAGAIRSIERDAQLSEDFLRCLVLRADAVPEKAMEEPFDTAIAPQVEIAADGSEGPDSADAVDPDADVDKPRRGPEARSGRKFGDDDREED